MLSRRTEPLSRNFRSLLLYTFIAIFTNCMPISAGLHTNTFNFILQSSNVNFVTWLSINDRYKNPDY